MDKRFCSLCRAFEERSRPGGAHATKPKSQTTKRRPGIHEEQWNGEFYVNYSFDRPWNDAVRYGFISGGGKEWYSRTLRLLNPGDRVWVNMPRKGYVGVGRVIGHAEQAKDFRVPTPEGKMRLLDIGMGAHYDWQKEHANAPEKCEWYVPVRWLQTLSAEMAIDSEGMYGNRNTVCKPRDPAWNSTVERLKELFPEFDKA